MSVRAQFIPLPPGEGQRVRQSAEHQRGVPFCKVAAQ